MRSSDVNWSSPCMLMGGNEFDWKAERKGRPIREVESILQHVLSTSQICFRE